MSLKRFLAFVCFFVTFWKVQCVSLERALNGSEKLRIMTITRSVSNNLIIDTEVEILQSTAECLVKGTKPDFSRFKETLSKDVGKYFAILKKISELRDAHKTELFVIKMQNLLEGDVSVEREVLDKFVATVLNNNSGKIKKGEPLLKGLFSEKADNVWEHLSEYDDGVSEVDIIKLLKVTDADVLKYFGSYSDEAIYQAISGIISVISRDFKDLYVESKEEKSLVDMLIAYYDKCLEELVANIEQVKKVYTYVPSVTMLVTNEYFWGKVPIEEAKAISMMTAWSVSLPDVLFCSNFLLINKLEDPSLVQELADRLTKLYIPAEYNPKEYENPFIDPVRMQWSLLMDSRFFTGEESAFQKYLEYLRAETTRVGIFKNESMIFWNKCRLTTYDKSTYIDEQDDLFRKSFIYVFGLGVDNIVAEIPEAKIVHASVSTQICRDLLAQIRKKDKGTQRYHILQSNTIDFNGEAIPPKAEYVIHVNFGSPAVVYRRALNFPPVPVDKRHMWDQVGPFDWHLNFHLGSSNYSIQTVCIGK